MRLLLAGDFGWNNGSSHVIREYVRHSASVGMEVAVSTRFGSRDEQISGELPYCDTLEWATHLLVVFESNPFLSDRDIEVLDSAIPRSRRAVIDADAHWSPLTSVGQDDNSWPCGQGLWRRQMQAVTDLILQPVLGTPSPGAVQFPYFGIPAPLECGADSKGDRADVQYVGSNWFRFPSLIEVFGAARNALGDDASLRVSGTFWDGSVRPGFEAGTKADLSSLEQLRVEVRPPVPFGQVVERMGNAVVTPVLVRPVLSRLRMLTPRMFETVAASTIPVYRRADDYIGELYQEGERLCLGEDPIGKIREIFVDQDKFFSVAREVRRRLYSEYSYPSLLRRLRALLDRMSV